MFRLLTEMISVCRMPRTNPVDFLYKISPTLLSCLMDNFFSGEVSVEHLHPKKRFLEANY
jgi:hypothetical protein